MKCKSYFQPFASVNVAFIVVVQVEELNSELDLRLHLHEPRAARAEQDVHNVRAGECCIRTNSFIAHKTQPLHYKSAHTYERTPKPLTLQFEAVFKWPSKVITRLQLIIGLKIPRQFINQ